MSVGDVLHEAGVGGQVPSVDASTLVLFGVELPQKDVELARREVFFDGCVILQSLVVAAVWEIRIRAG